MKDFSWATSAPKTMKIARGKEPIDLERLTVKEVRAWAEEAHDMLDNWRVEIADYVSMREERQRKVVESFRKERDDARTVAVRRTERKAAGITDDGMLAACTMILTLKVQTGAIDAPSAARLSTMLSNGDVDAVAKALGIPFAGAK